MYQQSYMLVSAMVSDVLDLFQNSLANDLKKYLESNVCLFEILWNYSSEILCKLTDKQHAYNIRAFPMLSEEISCLVFHEYTNIRKRGY